MKGVGITSAMASHWLQWAIDAGYVLLIVALLLGLWRAARGPELSDRLVALKHAWLVSIGFMAIFALQTHVWRILDLALVLALLGGVVPLASAWAGRRRSTDEPSAEVENADAH